MDDAVRSAPGSPIPLGDAVFGPRWRMLALNWLLYFSFGVGSSSTAALAVLIARDLDLSPAQLGAILGSWQLTYVGVAFGAGVALDRFGLRRTMAFGVLVIGLSGVLRASATDFLSLFLAVGLFGIGGPLISVGSNKVVSEWFGTSQRGTAMGIAVSAPTVGSVAMLALSNTVLVPLFGGWRGAIFASASVALVAAATWAILAREAPRHREAIHAKPDGVAIGKVVPMLLRLRNVRLILIGAIGTFAVSHGLGNWVPTLLVSRSFSTAEAGLLAAASTAIGLFASLLLPRAVAPGKRRYLLAVVALTGAVGVLGLAFSSGIVLVIALAVLGLSRAATSPLMMLLLMETRGIGPARTGAAAGLYFTFGEIGGFGGPFILGLLSGMTGGFTVPLVLLSTLPMLVAVLAISLDEAPAGRPHSVSEVGIGAVAPATKSD